MSRGYGSPAATRASLDPEADHELFGDPARGIDAQPRESIPDVHI